MLNVKTLNDKLIFSNKEEIIKYFNEGITTEGQEYFDNNNYYIEIEGFRIENVQDWEYWKNEL